jgi:hypothetical protein
MAKPDPDSFDPDATALAMRAMTGSIPSSPDRRGPWVYDVTEKPSLNGVDPDYQARDGAGNGSMD